MNVDHYKRRSWVVALAALAALMVAATLTPLALAAPQAAGPPYDERPGTYSVVGSCDVAVVMSDGIALRLNVARPADPGRFPAIVSVTGYNKGKDGCTAKDYWASRGYVRIILDDRGTGRSGGHWEAWGARTRRDYREVLDWIAAQPWSDGTVGTLGGSYLGITAFHVAETGHPSVKAVWADVPMADAYRDVALRGGNIGYSFILPWMVGVGLAAIHPGPDQSADPVGSLLEQLTRGGGVLSLGTNTGLDVMLGGETAYDGSFWQQRSPETLASTLRVPVAWTGGWFDIFQRGEARFWNALSGLDPSQKKWFQLPTYHGGGEAQWDELGLGSRDAVKLAWFDHWIRGVDNGVESIPSVNLYTMGSNRWQHPAAWPLPATDWTSLYLSSTRSGSASSLNDGSLTPDRDTRGADVLPNLPLGLMCSREPTQWTAGFLAFGSCETDQRFSEATALTYTTPPLVAPLELTGPLAATVWASVTGIDGQLVAVVSDVAPDGTSTGITAGTLNVRHRALDPDKTQYNAAGDAIVPYHPFSRAAEELATPLEAAEYAIEIFPTSQVFAAGHRLRLTIAASNVTQLAPIATTVGGLGATTVLSGPKYPSRLLLPVQHELDATPLPPPSAAASARPTASGAPAPAPVAGEGSSAGAASASTPDIAASSITSSRPAATDPTSAYGPAAVSAALIALVAYSLIQYRVRRTALSLE